MGNLIYIADDDIIIRGIIQSFLEKEGFEVEYFENGDLLFAAFERKQCALVIIDTLMPGSDGFMISAKIRQLSSLPIIMLSTNESDDDYVFGISLGIDAYLTKPFNPAKLIAHVRALLIKAELSKHTPIKEKRNELTFTDITIFPDRITTHCNGKELQLTNTEYSLLKFMIENQERAISRGELLNKIWGDDNVVRTRATDDTIKRLRRKLSTAQSQVSIETVWGFGFRLRSKRGNV